MRTISSDSWLIFASDPDLGIASGVYCRMTRGAVEGGRYAALSRSGSLEGRAARVLREHRWIYYISAVGIRWMKSVLDARGWRTTHFADLKMKHWKPEGTGMGLLANKLYARRNSLSHRRRRLFFLLKVRAPNDAPPLRGGSHRSPLGIPKGNGQTKAPPRHQRGSALLSSAS